VNVALQVTDLSFQHWPRYFPLRHRVRLRTLVPIHVRQARVVMTLSEFCRHDLMRTFDLPAERVFAIPCVVRPPQPPASTGETERVLARHGIRRPFFIYLGNRHPRKNLPRLVQAFSLAVGSDPELAGYRLVLAGAPWWRGGGEDRDVRLAPPGTVQVLGRLPDDERDLLVRAATALVYPSIFEGFGLPPLEAMAVGTPVLASNAAALPETLGDAALLVDPFDVAAMAAALIALATDAELRAKLRARGLRHAAQFTPRPCGQAAMAAFRVATSPSPGAN
jgi:glycosyltransferase involved in cell wall biosynthesis